MALKDPKDLLQGLLKIIERLNQTGAPISITEQQSISADLSEIYNYVSVSIKKPSFQNLIYAQSAHDARLKEQYQEERKQIELHRLFVESIFDKADQYFRTIQLGGYTAFFAVWGITRTQIAPFWGTLAVILMIASATTFVIWEIWKSTLLSLTLKHDALIGNSTIEDFIRARMNRLIEQKSKITELAKARSTAWFACVIPAAIALFILVWQLLALLSKHLDSI